MYDHLKQNVNHFDHVGMQAQVHTYASYIFVFITQLISVMVF
jgi:hypothetical protein